jgi:hypothetical protein
LSKTIKDIVHSPNDLAERDLAERGLAERDLAENDLAEAIGRHPT